MMKSSGTAGRRGRRRPSPQQGFTLLEIMVAVTVLVVGILGVLALFPVALKAGKQTIQDTNGMLIAQSVEQAIREGLQHRKGQSEDGKWTYFLFQHAGVKDPLPTEIGKANPAADYYVLLPERDTEANRRVVSRESAYARGKTFVFPETDGKSWEAEDGVVEEDDTSTAAPNGGGNPLRADDDGDDRTVEAIIAGEEESWQTVEVLDSYRLDMDFFKRASEDDLDDDIIEPGDVQDPIREYSFAFAIRPALNDASLDRHTPRDREFIPAGELFEVEVMVYRGFVARTANASSPILRSTFLIHK